MASSNDFEKIWESYQEVIKTKDISIVDYCLRRFLVRAVLRSTSVQSAHLPSAERTRCTTVVKKGWRWQ